MQTVDQIALETSTNQEIVDAIVAAVYKLVFIINREGTADGTRLTTEYFMQLVNEELIKIRFSQFTLENIKKKIPPCDSNHKSGKENHLELILSDGSGDVNA